MALLIECPGCKKRNSIKNKTCYDCEYKLIKATHKTYWIEYRINGRKKRERIGPSKLAAENRLRDVQKQKVEDRYVNKNKNARVTIGQLCDWYLSTATVKKKRSIQDIKLCLKNVCDRLGNDLLISQLTLSQMDKYQQIRLSEISRSGTPIKPSTINRDVANFKAALNKGVKFGEIESNPIQSIPMLEENNIREKVLSPEEFQKLYDACHDYLKPVVLTAYYLPMRQAEILKLTWKELDLKNGFIRLGGIRTKNKMGRVIPLHPKLIEIFQNLPRPLHGGRVFLKDGAPFDKCHKGYKAAIKRAGLSGWTFHDLRHCAINNLRLAGNDHYAIKAASGHKTDSAFKRYNLVTEEELKPSNGWTKKGEIWERWTPIGTPRKNKKMLKAPNILVLLVGRRGLEPRTT